MGLKFCNEAIMCLAQLYPPHPAAQAPEGNTPLQVKELLLTYLISWVCAHPYTIIYFFLGVEGVVQARFQFTSVGESFMWQWGIV